LRQVDLQTLVAAIQNAVQAQNLIATRIAALTTAFGVAFPPPFTSSKTWVPGGIGAGSTAATSIVVTGAVLGDFAQASVTTSLQGCSLSAYVSATNTGEAVITNNTGGTVTFASTTLLVSVTS
jgi:hypothetical protein